MIKLGEIFGGNLSLVKSTSIHWKYKFNKKKWGKSPIMIFLSNRTIILLINNPSVQWSGGQPLRREKKEIIIKNSKPCVHKDNWRNENLSCCNIIVAAEYAATPHLQVKKEVVSTSIRLKQLDITSNRTTLRIAC